MVSRLAGRNLLKGTHLAAGPETSQRMAPRTDCKHPSTNQMAGARKDCHHRPTSNVNVHKRKSRMQCPNALHGPRCRTDVPNTAPTTPSATYDRPLSLSLALSPSLYLPPSLSSHRPLTRNAGHQSKNECHRLIVHGCMCKWNTPSKIRRRHMLRGAGAMR